MYVCVMSTATETDVAVPDCSTVMESCMVLRSGMGIAGSLVCANCSDAPPATGLSGESTKSPASTPVTSSLNVTAKTRVRPDVVASAGSLLTIDVTVGAVRVDGVGVVRARSGWGSASLVVCGKSCDAVAG